MRVATTPPGVPRVLARALALSAMVAAAAAIGVACRPMFREIATYGGHDWDQMTAHRWLAVRAIRGFGELPFWNPYMCGGHPLWGAIESDTTLVSPFLPLYFLAPLALATRIEVVVMAGFTALGAWLLAGRFTRSPGLRLFAVAAWALDGRWALQVAAGHAWHFDFAWSAFALYFFDRAARDPESPRAARLPAACAGAMIALMVYTGAIYPLPQTILLIALWALACAWLRKSAAPLWAGVWTGAVSFGLSAPKLLPIVDTLIRFPRHIDSTEVFPLDALLAALTFPQQSLNSRPANVPQWGWHEWGQYIGWGPLVVLVLALALASTRVERALRALALALLVLALGAFAEKAPWSLLHHVPPFSSQHVPSRWSYLAVLVASVLAAAVGERLLGRRPRARPFVEVALLAGAIAAVVDVAHNDTAATAQTFWMELPPIQPAAEFHQERAMPAEYQYKVRDWAPAALGAEMAGIGVIDCNTFPGLNIYSKDASGVIRGLGAKARGEAGYKGEAWLASGVGTARLTRLTPDTVTVHVTGATKGDLLIVNQNWDPSWWVGLRPALAKDDVIAAVVPAPDATIKFRYFPRTLLPGLGVFAVTCALLARWLRPRYGA